MNKTQSAVSMQMKRLEERLERPIFSRDGRASKLTEDGQRLLDYARQIVKLNVETLAAFSDAELSGSVRMGVPDDYADRYLPEIMARFSRGYPAVELSVICEPSVDLLERIDANEIDLAIITNCESKRASNIPSRAAALGNVQPPFDSVSRNGCRWRSDGRAAPGAASPSNGWKRSAVRSVCSTGGRRRGRGRCGRARRARGLGTSRESGLRPGMRVLSASDGFPDLPSCRIGLVRNARDSALADALAEHIISSLDNLSDAAQAAE